MPLNKSNPEPTAEEEIKTILLSTLKNLTPGTPEYTAVLDQYDKFHKTLPKKDSWLKPELLVPAAANLIGIGAILNYERFHVVASKAIGLVIKTRL